VPFPPANTSILDTTIVATLTGPISSDFSSLSLLSWLATGYLIANAACQPLSGKLTDIFGRRAGLIFSNVFFGTGCLISGLAQSESVIIAGRIIAGMGGGGLNAISSFPSAAVASGKAMAISSSALAWALAGPLAAGSMTGSAGAGPF
jgi:MFS family permease